MGFCLLGHLNMVSFNILNDFVSNLNNYQGEEAHGIMFPRLLFNFGGPAANEAIESIRPVTRQFAFRH